MVPSKPGTETERGMEIDYRALNKVIKNEGWQIPNIKEML